MYILSFFFFLPSSLFFSPYQFYSKNPLCSIPFTFMISSSFSRYFLTYSYSFSPLSLVSIYLFCYLFFLFLFPYILSSQHILLHVVLSSTVVFSIIIKNEYKRRKHRKQHMRKMAELVVKSERNQKDLTWWISITVSISSQEICRVITFARLFRTISG